MGLVGPVLVPRRQVSRRNWLGVSYFVVRLSSIPAKSPTDKGPIGLGKMYRDGQLQHRVRPLNWQGSLSYLRLPAEKLDYVLPRLKRDGLSHHRSLRL